VDFPNEILVDEVIYLDSSSSNLPYDHLFGEEYDHMEDSPVYSIHDDKWIYDLFYQASFVVFWPMSHDFSLRCSGDQLAALNYLKSVSQPSADYDRMVETFFESLPHRKLNVNTAVDAFSLCRSVNHVRISLKAMNYDAALNDATIQEVCHAIDRCQMQRSYEEDFLAVLPGNCYATASMMGAIKYVAMLLDKLDGLDACRRQAMVMMVFDWMSDYKKWGNPRLDAYTNLNATVIDFLVRHDHELHALNLFVNASSQDQQWIGDLLLMSALPTTSFYQQVSLIGNRVFQYSNVSSLRLFSFQRYLRFLIRHEDALLREASSFTVRSSPVIAFLDSCRDQLQLSNDNMDLLDYIRNIQSTDPECKYLTELRELALHWIFSLSSASRTSTQVFARAIIYLSADFISREEQDQYLQRMQDEWDVSETSWNEAWKQLLRRDRGKESEYFNKVFQAYTTIWQQKLRADFSSKINQIMEERK
jgi:hypothetical protein